MNMHGSDSHYLIDFVSNFQIDEVTLPLMEEEDLKQFLPLKGDRVAARQYCSTSNSRFERKTLLDRLRQKFTKKSSETIKDTSRRGIGNENSSKTNRTVEIGWMNYSLNTSSYKQVRSPKGGGTRVLKLVKTVTAAFVLEKAKSLFFPEGTSKLGSLSNFTYKLCDFNLCDIADEQTIDDIYAKFQMRTLRVYMCTTLKADLYSSDSEKDIPQIKSG